MKNKFLVVFFAFILITTLGASQPAHAGGLADAVGSAVGGVLGALGDVVGGIVDIAGNLIDNAISIASGVIQGTLNLITGGSFADGYKQGFCNLGGGGYGILTGGDCDDSTHTTVGQFWKITSSSGANGDITPSGVTIVLEGLSASYMITPSAYWVIDSLVVDGVAQPAAKNTTSYAYTFDNVLADHTITATFALAAVPVTGACGSVAGTTVSSLTSSSANLCSSATPTVTSGSFSSGITVWSWTCDGLNSGGKSPLCTAYETPVKPTVTFLANPGTVVSGDSSILQWAETGAVSCTASGNWSGSKSIPKGFELQSNITTNKSYTLTCVNRVGVSTAITRTVSITSCVTDCSAAKRNTVCLNESVSNGCGGTCLEKGNRVCSSSWKEIAP